ncbi:hypothetical protein AAFF_G00254220 [Aldrovandia affinis]|uniref:G-protein coupled receptors family 3 profile domain-containing protein n=1 Tax=Aldrovandia affinis TaxID=143900 RepID=A0AAD7W2G2_9TELE|nr:hypothetical protein AAFF_G00254220 [Aldrovandia affinis]
MIRTNTSRTWIASDAWSISRPLASMEGINEVGDIFGFTFITGENPGFEDYLQKLRPGTGAVNHFIQEYKQLRFSCTPELLQHRECLDNKPAELCPIPDSLMFKSPEACSLPDPQLADDDFLLLEELKKVNFNVDNGTNEFYFDDSGNFVTGYDLIMWVKARDQREFITVGRYSLKEGEVELSEDRLQWINSNGTVPQSRCSERCAAGTVKKVSNISCCYNCTECEEGAYTDDWNQHDCKKCPNGTWSLRGWNHCEERTKTFQRWKEPYAIALVTAAGLGILLLLSILILFLVHRKTPMVKIAGGKLCYVMIVGLSVSFGSVVLFVGKPNDHLCQARQVMYGLGFTLCVSCILVRAFRTFLAFLFDLNRQHELKKLYKPLAIVLLVTAVQGLICTFWLIFDSPKVNYFDQGMEKWLQCTEGTSIGFSIMLSYISLLAFVCFLLAFKGRKVPQDFNETGNIIFGMLIYLFVWVCFIPLYINRNKLNERSIVQASTILASNYGIIFCHFLPKCYIVLCRKKENVREEIERKLRIFSITSAGVLDITSMDSGVIRVLGENSVEAGSVFQEETVLLETSVVSSGLGQSICSVANLSNFSEGEATSPRLRERRKGRMRSSSF